MVTWKQLQSVQMQDRLIDKGWCSGGKRLERQRVSISVMNQLIDITLEILGFDNNKKKKESPNLTAQASDIYISDDWLLSVIHQGKC